MSATEWEEWNPPWAAHVQGRYERRRWDAVLERHEPQRVEVRCLTCGATWQVDCEQGRPREHVATFARVHLHGADFHAVKLE